MKKVLLFLVSAIIFCSAAIASAHGRARGVIPPNLPRLSFDQLLKLTPAEYGRITGTKMNFFRRMEFSVYKRSIYFAMKKTGRAGGRPIKEKNNFFSSKAFWFLAGFAGMVFPFLFGLLAAHFTGPVLAYIAVGLIPVAAVYITKQDPENQRALWHGVRYGLLADAVAFVILIIAALGSLKK